MFTWFSTTLRKDSKSLREANPRQKVKRLPARPALLAAIALATSFACTTADARIGGGMSFGSRGSRTFSMPSPTTTAPRISPFQRSETPSNTYSGAPYGRPASGLSGGGFGRGLLGGFLGAGLFGLLFGSGFGGGLGGGMSLIGLILQIGLLYLLFRFVMGFFASRRPSMSGMSRSGFGTLPGGASVYGNSDVGRTQGRPLQLRTEDYQTFEQRLMECQEAYSQGDLATLRRIATPEMVRNFERELADYERRGLVNRLSDVRMTQGDLSEAWNENGIDYATVAMRFSIVDTTIERSSGRVVAGDARVPQNVTEVWTFLRPAGAGASGWTLSAIQQA